MHAYRTPLLNGMRWALLALLLLVAGLLYSLSEGSFDRLTRPLCPEGWWRTGEFWAHCSYPAVSIAKYGAMYGSFAALALLLVHFAAPSHRQACSRALLLALMAAPAFHLLSDGPSWVVLSRLCGVGVLWILYEAFTWVGRRRT